MRRSRRHHPFRDSVQRYTAGLSLRQAHRVLGRDASRAYRVLTREQADRAEPKGKVRRLWHRTRMLFLGLSYKLSPPRRILFAACVVLAILGFQGLRFEVEDRLVAIGGGSPLLLAAFCGLVFLLVLELADRVLVRDELEVARQLQRELLPARPPAIDGFSFAFSYRTANTIGGDYYDFLPVGSSTIAIVVADASGHGIAAGLLMAIANATLKLAIDLNPNPEAVADLMNRVLYRTGGSRSFMTMFYGLLDPATGRLEYVSVGHPYPLLRRASGDLEELGVGCLPLGVRSSITPRPGATTLNPGDLLIMYTDGIPEALDEQDNAFGFERLSSLVALGGGAASVHDRAFAALERFTEGAIQLDDRSLVVISRDA